VTLKPFEKAVKTTLQTVDRRLEPPHRLVHFSLIPGLFAHLPGM
jgi:hypothetical protein